MELGWKTTLADGALRFNGSIYKIDWKDIQVSQFDSQNISILTIVDNGGDAEIMGIEGDLDLGRQRSIDTLRGSILQRY